MASGRYQTLRSVSDIHIFVVCHDKLLRASGGSPQKGTMAGDGRGEIESLKPEYRLALARDGYALGKCELAVFKPEA